MTLVQLKNWLESQTDCRVTCGWIDSDAEQSIGVYFGKPGGKDRICLGGMEATSYRHAPFTVLIHWGKTADGAAQKAQEVWGLFHGLAGEQVGESWVISADPGAGPVPVGRDQRGVFEYVINIDFLVTERS